MNGKIHLNGMVFYGRHGHHPEETRLGQRFELDLVLELDIGPAAASDDLRLTADYGKVFALCREIVEGVPMKLIETLAHRILAAVLERHSEVTRATVVVRKPSVPIEGVLSHVAVEASLSRA